MKSEKAADPRSSNDTLWHPGPKTLVWLLLLGWVLPAVFVYGPSCFLGTQINLPADLLHLPTFYIPVDPEKPAKITNSISLMDLIQLAPPGRQLIADEYRAGRVPVWNPYIFCGAPFAVATKYSPFELPYILFPSPQTLVWMQLLQNVCIGMGTWFYLRKSIGVSLWSGVISSWASPWLGFLTVWQGFTALTAAVCWLPWLLLFTDYSFRFRFRIWTPLLAVTTAVMILSGAADIAALVLVTCGLRLLWNLLTEFLIVRSAKAAILAAGSVGVGWLLGIVMASPFLLPLIQYSRSGSRMEARVAGTEERPPIGLSAFWSVAFPERYGGSRVALPYVGEAGKILESSSGAFSGGVVLFLMVPIAIFTRGKTKEALFWVVLIILGLSWQFSLPVLTSLQRSPPLNLLSWSRWVFASSFSMLVLMSLAFDVVLSTENSWRTPFRFGIPSLLAFVVIGCVLAYRIPEPFADKLLGALEEGFIPGFDGNDVSVVRWQARSGYVVAVLSGIAALAAVIHRQRSATNVIVPFVILAIAVLGELLWFARVQVRVSHPENYFPRVAALEALSQLPKGRVFGIECLPPNLNQMANLYEVRGYDAVDPRLMTLLLARAADSSSFVVPYARTQWMVPQIRPGQNSTLRVSPILDMLNVRYVITRKTPVLNWPAIVQTADYWVLENAHAAPRAFIPKNVVVCEDETALQQMESLSFRPLEIAFAELPEKPIADASGKVTIVTEHPSFVELEVEMQKEGIVVVSDSWAPDWTVAVDGKKATSLRMNVAVRGVRVPAGKHIIVWKYWPKAISQTLPWSVFCAAACFLWSLAEVVRGIVRPSRSATLPDVSLVA